MSKPNKNTVLRAFIVTGIVFTTISLAIWKVIDLINNLFKLLF